MTAPVRTLDRVLCGAPCRILLFRRFVRGRGASVQRPNADGGRNRAVNGLRRGSVLVQGRQGPDGWLWPASTFRTSRGRFRIRSKNEQAHCVAWQLTRGAPPSGVLRSRCGNLRCVGPDHHVVADRYVGPTNLRERLIDGSRGWSNMGLIAGCGSAQPAIVATVSSVSRSPGSAVG
jgi:hypothetical protein